MRLAEVPVRVQTIGLEDLARPIGSVAHGSNETLGKIDSGSYAPMPNACLVHLGMTSACVLVGRTAIRDPHGRQWIWRIRPLVVEGVPIGNIFANDKTKVGIQSLDAVPVHS